MHSDLSRPSGHPRVICEAGATAADEDAYKQLSVSAAKGVAVVSCVHRGWDNAVTVTDYLSVSYDPPTVLVSLYSLSRMAEALAETDAPTWGLSLLTDDQRPVADVLGEQGSPLVALLDHVPHFRRTDADSPSEEGAAPKTRRPALVRGALAWFELRTTAVHEAATHLLFVGEVVAMGRDAPAAARPLVRYQSGYLDRRP